MLKKNQTEILELKKNKNKNISRKHHQQKRSGRRTNTKGGVRTNSDVYSRIKRVCDEHDQPSQVL